MEPRSIIRWQHRLKREHPTCTERTKALIQECGWKGGDSDDSAGKQQCDQQIPKRIPLTPIGLLMEGDYTHGVGIGTAMEGTLASMISEGRLIQVLKDWCPTFQGYFLYYPSRRNQPAALSALIDTLRLSD